MFTEVYIKIRDGLCLFIVVLIIYMKLVPPEE